MKNVEIPNLVLFGAHRWKRERIIVTAMKVGCHPILVMFENECPSEEAMKYAGERLEVLRLTSDADIQALSANLSERNQTWFTIGLDDYVCELAAVLSEKSHSGCSMPGSAAQTVLHKHLLRRNWNIKAIGSRVLYPVPFRLMQYANLEFNSLENIHDDLDPLARGPWIVKPDALDASIAVHSARHTGDLDVSVALISKELSALVEDAREAGISIASDVLIETSIPRSEKLHAGAEFSAEYLSYVPRDCLSPIHVLIGITQKYIHSDTFVELAHCFPSELFPEALRPVLQETTESLLDQLGVRFCISHWEYIVTNDERLALVEAQLRPAGDNIMDLVARSTGLDPIEIFFNMLLKPGSDIPFKFTPAKVAAIFFPAPTEDISGSMSIVGNPIELAANLPGNLTVVSELSGSQRWSRQTKWHSRLLRIIGEGESFADVKASCQTLISQLAISCEDSSGRTRYVGLSL